MKQQTKNKVSPLYAMLSALLFFLVVIPLSTYYGTTVCLSLNKAPKLPSNLSLILLCLFTITIGVIVFLVIRAFRRIRKDCLRLSEIKYNYYKDTILESSGKVLRFILGCYIIVFIFIMYSIVSFKFFYFIPNAKTYETIIVRMFLYVPFIANLAFVGFSLLLGIEHLYTLWYGTETKGVEDGQTYK